MKIQLMVFGWLLLVLQTPSPNIPAFTFYKANGGAFTTAMIPKGKYSMFLFVDPSCDHCQQAVGSFNDQYPEFAKTNIFVISLSEHTTLAGFMAKYAPGLAAKKNIVMLQDKQNAFIRLFGPRRYPGMFLYSPTQQLMDYEDNPQSIFRFVNELKKTK